MICFAINTVVLLFVMTQILTIWFVFHVIIAAKVTEISSDDHYRTYLGLIAALVFSFRNHTLSQTTSLCSLVL